MAGRTPGARRDRRQATNLVHLGTTSDTSRRQHRVEKPHTCPTSCAVSIRTIIALVLMSAYLALSGGIIADQRHLDKVEPLASISVNRTAACQHLRSAQDIQRCFPARVSRSLSVAQSRKGCKDIQTWNDVQRCLTGRFVGAATSNQTSPRITHVRILGERNSGTKFVTTELQQCFRSLDQVKIRRDFLRGKHWFQPIDKEDGTDLNHALVVVVVREPVEWMAAMLQSPYHSPSHVQGFDAENHDSVIPLPWYEFVHRPWTTNHSASDVRILQDTRNHRNSSICREHFKPYYVVPCQSEPTDWMEQWKIPSPRWRGYEPIYEHRPQDGTPYEHLLQLRSDKIVNWILQLPMLMRLGGFVVVRYEDLLERGTQFLLQRVAHILAEPNVALSSSLKSTSLPATCQPTPPQPERIGRRHVPSDFRRWIKEHVTVETERLVGYHRP
jgi:hypothetical protein